MPATQPVDIANRALDECGLPELGDLEDGTPTARAVTRVYWPALRQLLSGAHWNFARKDLPLTLLADVTGNLIADRDVPAPWSLMYDWPVDCVGARFVPQTYPQTLTTDPPIFSSDPQTNISTLGWTSPAPFVVSSSTRPNPIGSQWWETEGHDPDQTRVILTNTVGAHLVYTALMQYPDAWDPMFEQAMVALLAARLAMPLIADKKEARIVRADNIAIAKSALDMARVRDGDEGWTVADHTPDWIRARTSWLGIMGEGVWWYSWASVPGLDDAGGVY